MDFGEILEEWEKYKKKEKKKQKSRVREELTEWLEKHSSDIDRYAREKDSGSGNDRIEAARRREELRKMKPERTLDLHGFRVKEAEIALDTFIEGCKRSGIKKVLIIHGKGKHSKEEPRLRKAVIRFLEKNPYAGEFGVASREYGGKGALWLIIK